MPRPWSSMSGPSPSCSALQAALGDDHPDVVATLYGMALVYDKQGEYAKALEFHERALSISALQAALGDDYPDVAATLYDMALVCKKHCTSHVSQTSQNLKTLE